MKRCGCRVERVPNDERMATLRALMVRAPDAVLEIGPGLFTARDPDEHPPADRIVYCPLHAAAERLCEYVEKIAVMDIDEEIQGYLDEALALLSGIAPKAPEPEGRSTLSLPFASPSDGSGTEETR